MGRSRFTVLKILAIGLFAVANGPCDCNDDKSPTGPKLITISGVVRNIDTAIPAAGIRVSLYSNASYADVVPTGSDGKYSIQVPSGTSLVLFTDDFDSSHDAWFPFINCDVPVISVDQLSQADRNDWPIHCCPQTQAPAAGSVAVWDDYLANRDDPLNGDLFAASSSGRSGGIIAMAIYGCNAGTFFGLDSMSVTCGSARFPTGYWKAGNLATLTGPDVFYPSSQTVTDVGGFAVCIGDSTATDTTVPLTFTDMKAGRGLAWPGQPYACPVRRGTISLVWVLEINGVTSKAFKETAICGGLLPSSLVSRRLGRAVR